MYFSYNLAIICSTLSSAWHLHKVWLVFNLVYFVEVLGANESSLQISHVSQRVLHCDASLEVLVDEAGVSACGCHCQPFPCQFSHGGFLTAHLFYLYQIISSCSWWKSTNSSLPLRQSILLWPTQHQVLWSFLRTELNSLYSNALIQSLKPEMCSEKKLNFSIPACIVYSVFDVPLAKTATPQKARLKRRICIWWSHQAQRTIFAGCLSLSLRSWFICLQDGKKKGTFLQIHIWTRFDSASKHLWSIMWLYFWFWWGEKEC